jgi:glycosyltransferase involved in cell wall biosynthesis
VRDALDRLLADAGLRRRMGSAARARAVGELSSDVLVERLAPIAAGDLSSLVALA